MLLIFLRTLVLYAVVIFGMRIMGKRQLGELQPSELVVTILISNIATLPIEDTDVPLLAGIIPILTLMCFEVILSFLTLHSKRLRQMVSGNPRLLIQNGRLDQKEMLNIRYSIDDLMAQLRANGVFDLREVDWALVETTGKLSVNKKAANQPATPKDLKLIVAQNPPPVVVISDGEVLDRPLRTLHMDEKQLETILRRHHLTPKEVFLMTCTNPQDYYIIPRCSNGPTHDGWPQGISSTTP